MSPSPRAPRLDEFPHSIAETLRFADTDRNGHITSSVFAICCQSGRLALLSHPVRRVEPPLSQFVLASLQLDCANCVGLATSMSARVSSASGDRRSRSRRRSSRTADAPPSPDPSRF